MIYSPLGAQWTLARGLALANQQVEVAAAQIAVLDATGDIVAVNSVWREFAIRHQLDDLGLGVGVNYLDVCEQATRNGAAEATDVALIISDVLANRGNRAVHYYDSDGHDYEMRLLRFEEEGQTRVVIAHVAR